MNFAFTDSPIAGQFVKVSTDSLVDVISQGGCQLNIISRNRNGDNACCGIFRGRPQSHWRSVGGGRNGETTGNSGQPEEGEDGNAHCQVA